MMTSRAEYRLLLRQDNADMRLTEKGRAIGLVSDARYARFTAKKDKIIEIKKLLHNKKINPSREINNLLKKNNLEEIKTSTVLYDLLKRKDVTYNRIAELFTLPMADKEVVKQVETDAIYEGYINKQKEQVERMEKLEDKKIPEEIDYLQIPNLREEAIEKLNKIKPISLGQASRISGVSPADISMLLIYLKQHGRALA